MTRKNIWMKHIWSAVIAVVYSFSIETVRAQAVPASSQTAQSNTYLVSANERDFLARFIFSTISEHSNINFEYVHYPEFGARLKAVQTGQIDFAANITYTRARSNLFIFSQPTNIEPTYLFSQKGQSFESMNTVGTSMYTAFTDIIQKYYPNKRVIDFNNNDVAYYAIKKGHIDGYIGTFLQLEEFLNAGFKATQINDQVSIPPVSIITNKEENRALLRRFNLIISQETVQKQLREKLDEYISSIAVKHLRQLMHDSDIDGSLPIRILLTQSKPYVFLNDAGNVAGISVDFAKQICALNALKCQFTYHSVQPLSKLTLPENDIEYDVITPVSSSYKLSHFKRGLPPVNHKTYVNLEGVIAKRMGYKDQVHKHVSELFSEKVGVIANGIFAKIAEQLLPNKEFIYFSDSENLLNGLRNRTIDYAVTDRVTLNKILYDKKTFDIVEDPYFSDFYTPELQFGFADTQRGRALSQLFSRTLDFVDAESITLSYQPPSNWKEVFEQKQEQQRSFVVNLLLVLLALVTLLFGFVTNHRANHDALTKLRNRHSLNRIAKQSLGKGNCLIYIDLNEFKHVNDTYGHSVGDQVLKCYAKLLNKVIDGNIYRIGGDEFVVISPINEGSLKFILPKLESFEFVVRQQHVTLQLTASMGVFLSDVSDLTIKDLLVYTDLAMYEAKGDAVTRSVIIDKYKLETIKRMHHSTLHSLPPKLDAVV
ncbi:GGDEF domain-containing protein [Vibrio sp. ZSDZ34]|uniref:GGDEF domain-containing protein n=1 Tax=Vibrio gelatinilyticus TaxID=2893468 RepID=A0A9X1WCA4_9VIBR|nr:GGDEF domain-containing protein [Vibrio gelatinilyticus]MCJ2376508.1 GGDEF domain-containing protein [Vibrio gelatinilyticus]